MLLSELFADEKLIWDKLREGVIKYMGKRVKEIVTIEAVEFVEMPMRTIIDNGFDKLNGYKLAYKT